MKVPRRQKVTTELLTIEPPTTKAPDNNCSLSLSPSEKFHVPEIYVDKLLANARKGEEPKDDKLFVFKGNSVFGVNYGLSFFSDSRLLSFSVRLQNNKINDLVQRISSVIQGRVKPGETVSAGSLTRSRGNLEGFTNTDLAFKWITIYFASIHPVHPFLDRKSFEATAGSPGLAELLKSNYAWSALYHSVLALGCQHDGGGSFEPGKGMAWKLFSTSLALFPDLITLPDSLVALQAMTAMAIYASGVSCLSIEHVIISEAARRAQRLIKTNLTGSNANAAHKVFWVLYSMEKTSSFYVGRSSAFMDYDISCPIPRVTDGVFGNFDWFLTHARHSRLLSRAWASLFSAGLTGTPNTYYIDTIDQLNAELENWRLSIPEDIRPGKPFQAYKMGDRPQGSAIRQAALWTHYLYSSYRLMLARATLQLAATFEGLVTVSRQAGCKTLIMGISRSILELTTFIDAEPSTPTWIIAGVPIIALFNLFELVIHNPKHHETWANLALLDVAGGYFSRLEYSTRGSLPASLISEFVYIAREYVNNLNRPLAPDQDNPTVLATSPKFQKQAQPGILPPTPSLTSPVSSVPHIDEGIGAAHSSSMSLEDTGSVPLDDALNFPISDIVVGMNDDFLLGTDVMDLFSYTIPGLDPITFGQGLPQDNT